jgi:hypothetical protein
MCDGFACYLANFKNLAAAGIRKGTRGDQAKLSLYPVAFPDQIVEVQAGPANFPVGLALLAHQHLQEENLLLIVKLLQIRANTLVFFQAPRPLGTG